MVDTLRDSPRRPLREFHTNRTIIHLGHTRIRTHLYVQLPHTQKYATRLETDKPKTAILETTKTDPADFLTLCPPTLESEDDVHCSAGGI